MNTNKKKLVLLFILISFVPYSCKGQEKVKNYNKVNLVYSAGDYESGEIDWIIPLDTIFIDLNNDGIKDVFHNYIYDYGRGSTGEIFGIFIGDSLGNYKNEKYNSNISNGSDYIIKKVEPSVFSITIQVIEEIYLEIFFKYDDKKNDWFCYEYNVYNKKNDQLIRKMKLQKEEIVSFEQCDSYNLYKLFEYYEKYPSYRIISLKEDAIIRKKPTIDSKVYNLNEFEKKNPVYFLEEKNNWAYVKFMRSIEEFGWVPIKDILLNIKSPKATIYTAPNQASKMYLVKGDEVECLEEKEGWYKIRYYGKKTIEGWVKKEDILE